MFCEFQLLKIHAAPQTDISRILTRRKSPIQKVSKATRSRSLSLSASPQLTWKRKLRRRPFPDGKVVADLIHARLSIPVEEVLEETEMTAVQDNEMVALTDEDDPIVMDAVEEAELGNRDVNWQD